MVLFLNHIPWNAVPHTIARRRRPERKPTHLPAPCSAMLFHHNTETGAYILLHAGGGLSENLLASLPRVPRCSFITTQKTGAYILLHAGGGLSENPLASLPRVPRCSRITTLKQVPTYYCTPVCEPSLTGGTPWSV